MKLINIVLIAAIVSSGPVSAVTFTDVTSDAGIRFTHVHGGSGEKYYVETMGSGACWLDHDGDDDLDLYIVNSAPLPGFKTTDKPRNHLYRNEGDGRFTDVTEAAGVGDTGYGMGCVAGDIDNDGDTDLHVTNFGANILYRNEGSGKFADATEAAGVGDSRWSASSAFGDIDNDGDLDLYVTNYLDFTVDNNKYCGQQKPGHRAYCHPDEYNGVSDSLYRNRGDGTFEDISRAAGIANPIGKGLGVVFSDFDNDGWVDIYVANDKTINFLYANGKNGTFADASMGSGVGFSESGMPQAGMGTDAGDINGDGLIDLIVTNLDYETNELYVNTGELTFTNVTFQAGLGQPNFLHVGFGADFLDFDNDGDKDLLIANGHILDNIELTRDQVTYEQPLSMLANDGTGKFSEAGSALGKDFTLPGVGRGLAVADYDSDGDLDFFVVQSNRQPRLMRNDGGNDLSNGGGNWLRIRLEGKRSNRGGVGARVRIITKTPDGKQRLQVDEVRAGSSYLSCHDPVLHFGLGSADTAATIEIHWPAGSTQTLKDVSAGRVITVKEE